jgi:ADP-heptose:LPS heptosyltransferase
MRMASPPRSGRCLVLSLDGLGDMVLRQPLLRGLADAGYDVHVLVQEGYEPLLRFLDERMRGMPAPVSWTSPPTVAQAHALFERVRRLDPALVVSAQFNPAQYVDWFTRTLPDAFVAGFAGGATQEIPGARPLEPQLGLPEARPFDLVVACAEAAPETDKARALLAALTGRTPPSDPPRLTVGPSDRERAAAVLGSLGFTAGRFAVCYPAGTKNVTLKAWPAERYGRIAAWLVKEKKLPTLVMGHASEATIVDAVVAAARAAGGDVRAWSAGDGDLETMISVLASATLYFGNDTGAMHIAAAAGVPVVAVFGGGHWPRFLPVAQRGAVHTRMLPCFGCGWHDCFFVDGPCVHRVEEDAIRSSILRILEGANGLEIHAEVLPLGEADWVRAVMAFRALVARAASLREATPSRGVTELASRTAPPSSIEEHGPIPKKQT